MKPTDIQPEYRKRLETGPIAFQTTVFFIVSIAAIGAVMMTLTSSPTAKGASFLWIPAALQLMAGVWLGPWRGMIAGGIGAYLAGILAYGGWGLVDIIMNLIAGGVANSFLPGILFRILRIDLSFGTDSSSDPKHILHAAGRLGGLLCAVLALAFVMRPLNIGLWGHIPPLILVISTPLIFRGLTIQKRHFIPAFIVCILVSAVSALIGVLGQVVGGQTWQAAFLGTGIGWFLGDTVSAVLGLYMLAAFSERAKEAGISNF